MALNFKRIDINDAEQLLKWRTSPEITQHMFTDLKEPSLKKQQAWIESLQDRKDYRGYMIQDDGMSIGFLCFSDIDYVHQRCSTGSYIYERAARLKYGVTMHTYICNYVFYQLKMNKIVNHVLNANEKVVKLQTLHKTRLVGFLKQHIFKNGQFLDVYIFEQLKEDWLSQKQHYSLEKISAAFNDWNFV
ncbi:MULTISPECIES: UDP-4-amino-4,6-dideoxy-N-acetyl-beta-L-altrosamine N-acetyltransferase [unclassified Shewanella]|jgi:UDP-4-amino-4,6-dideoxy-N-acetyl-beta-L-altrosamine N-acetyltransferase|uniref:UDP-4-amino-4, 6-dideoxy-N-acetyl-beta-L-altrosamine N-acetyltransferase n=1 Tax=Shewanella TaxID=22 RepID=UPI001566B8D5|nr:MULTISPECIES: UDP-4-amino-4,6-dideoxy-N-acetyl-beta-L-altrosamine N-acetyltransferase [unclassified Shewanella]MBI1674473.1 UDP-4-amino-4,6-dideoxy-N-acetyl-beta-L-altrosamine N-acetyltransferase [Shewanella sp. DW31]MBW3514014.1 UDP-4-amino-4,6-dideoxy-N-acetyl-beta-L-altrosamine N-acetyltransferase [Shewanella sp. NKUCC01_JLK]NRD31249.1 UDP-4-amino-4,6-dideoxy-N-acetyl-beta-L-altrosamine N-acetyltransferase [Shewanella sp. DC2-4]